MFWISIINKKWFFWGLIGIYLANKILVFVGNKVIKIMWYSEPRLYVFSGVRFKSRREHRRCYHLAASHSSRSRCQVHGFPPQGGLRPAAVSSMSDTATCTTLGVRKSGREILIVQLSLHLQNIRLKINAVRTHLRSLDTVHRCWYLEKWYKSNFAQSGDYETTLSLLSVGLRQQTHRPADDSEPRLTIFVTNCLPFWVVNICHLFILNVK